MQRKSKIFVDLKNKSFSNNKKTIIFLLLFVLIVSLLAGFVEAQDKSLWDNIKESPVLKFLTVDMVNEFNSSSPSTEAQLVAKALFVILFFAIFFGASSIAPGIKGFSKNIRVTITLLLAIISGIAIPSNWMVTLVQSYGGLLILALLFLPAVILIYANFSWVIGEDRGTQFIKFLFMIILLFVLHHAGNVAEGMGVDILETGIDILEIIFGILAFWYLVIGGIFGKSEETKEKLKQDEKGLLNKILDNPIVNKIIGKKEPKTEEEKAKEEIEEKAEEEIKGRELEGKKLVGKEIEGKTVPPKKRAKRKKDFEGKMLGYFDASLRQLKETHNLFVAGDEKGAKNAFGQAKRNIGYASNKGIGFLNKLLDDVSDPTIQNEIKTLQSSLLKLRKNMDNLKDFKKYAWFLNEYKKIIAKLIAGTTAILKKTKVY